MRLHRRGFSLIEMLVVIAMIGILLTIMVPKIRVSRAQKTYRAAEQLVQDIEMVRTRAITGRALTRIAFVTATNSYTPYFDDNGDGALTQSAAETAAIRGLQTRTMTDGVIYGRGAAPQLPGFAGAGVVTFASTRVDFDTRGLTTPFGTKGVVYFTNTFDATAIAAVSVTAGAGTRRWVYRGGVWQ